MWQSLSFAEQAHFLADLQGVSEGKSSGSSGSSGKGSKSRGKNVSSSSSTSSLSHVLAVSGEDIAQETRDIQCQRDRDLVIDATRALQQQTSPCDSRDGSSISAVDHDDSGSNDGSSGCEIGKDGSGVGGSPAQLQITDSVRLRITPSPKRSSRKGDHTSNGNDSSIDYVATLDCPLTMIQLAELQASVSRAGADDSSEDKGGKVGDASLRNSTTINTRNSAVKWNVTVDGLFYPPAALFEGESGSALGLNDDNHQYQLDSPASASADANASSSADGDKNGYLPAASSSTSRLSAAEQQMQFFDSGPFAHEMRRAHIAAAAVASASLAASSGIEKPQQSSSASSLLSWSSSWTSSTSPTASSSASTDSPLSPEGLSTFGHAMLEQLVLLRHHAQKAQVFQQHLATAYEAEQLQQQQEQRRGRDSDSSSSGLSGLSSFMGSGSSSSYSSSSSSERHHRLRQLLQQVDQHSCT